MKSAPPRLSAAALEAWSQCPRRYALSYRARRYWPAAPQVQGALAGARWGEELEEGSPEEAALTAGGPLGLAQALRHSEERRRRFAIGAAVGTALHARIWALAEGRPAEGIALDPAELAKALGLPPAAATGLPALAQAQAQLEQAWVQHLRWWAQQPTPEACWNELKLEGAQLGLRLELRLDRLVKEQGRWWIVDFKSGKAPKGKEAKALRLRWQAKLYPWALARLGEALGEGPIPPEAIGLRFVYLGDPAGPQELAWPHSLAADAAVEAELRALAPRLAEDLQPEAPLASWHHFPPPWGAGPRPESWGPEDPCLGCAYFALCHPLGGAEGPAQSTWGPARFAWRLDGPGGPGDAEGLGRS